MGEHVDLNKLEDIRNLELKTKGYKISIEIQKIVIELQIRMWKSCKQFICLNAIVFGQNVALNPIGLIEIKPNPNITRIIVPKDTINTDIKDLNLVNQAGVLIRENCIGGIFKNRNKHFTWRSIKINRTNGQLQININ